MLPEGNAEPESSADTPPGYAPEVTPEMERRNLWIFSASYALVYFAAPVSYVGVVQAALCNRLGASAALANLPASGYNIGFLAPFLFACLIPSKWEKRTMVIASFIVAFASAVCCITLVLPVSNGIRIATVVSQGTVTGFADSITTVYRYQCLGRGTTTKGRARVLKVAFTLGPLCAVAGSLTVQFILNSGDSFLHYPYDFGFIYAIASAGMLMVALLSRKYEMAWMKEEHRPSFSRLFTGAFRSFLGNRELRFLWLACFFWCCTWNSMPSLSLYSRHIVGSSHQDVSGLIMAVRFACKSLMGFVLGTLALRFGIRMPLLAATLLSAAGVLWVWVMPGYLFLVAFGLLGAGELGTPYFNNYVVSVSNVADGARNLALINFATAAAAASPVIYGLLIDHFGFDASFLAGIGVGFLAFATLFRLPRGTSHAGTPDLGISAEHGTA
jgi:MFS family permease